MNKNALRNAAWIWPDPDKYPEYQRTAATIFESDSVPYCMVRFEKEYIFPANIISGAINVSGDCRYRLYINGQYIGMGPAFAGGDWGRKEPMPVRYYDSYDLPSSVLSTADDIGGSTLCICAEVQLPPTLLCDISSGRGGFILSGILQLSDGSTSRIATDETWDCFLMRERLSDTVCNYSLAPLPMGGAVRIDMPLPSPSEIPVNRTDIMFPDERGLFDMIYTGTLICDIETDRPCEVRLVPFETEGVEDEAEIIRTSCNFHYEGMRIRSVGGIKVEVEALPEIEPSRGTADLSPEEISGCNRSRRGGALLSGRAGTPAVSGAGTSGIKVSAYIRATRYPGDPVGSCRTGTGMDAVMKICGHTLSICRQSIHLDSPRHMEPLGCTGDYWLESLMEYYCYEDSRLTRFDIVRTARLIEASDGFMFHTAYSLMWIEMLRDYILYTGDSSIISEVYPAAMILFKRFEGYENENMLVSTPPSFMFADWVEIEGCSMHHPPKALGQTILNALYYKALRTAGKLFGEPAYTARAESVKDAFNRVFWNEERGLYISGLTGETDTNEWLPENPDRIIYTAHANAMAAACGLCSAERGREIMQKVMEDRSLPDYQPYYAHFVLQALWNTGLFDRYAPDIFKRWLPMAAECSKGLAEGWIKPCDNYEFDHSHAWGGCPRYWLPRGLIGLEILEPGFRRISLKPRLSCFENAEVRLPTPFGLLACTVSCGKITSLSVPEGIIFDNQQPTL